jgi:hypothetical protein
MSDHRATFPVTTHASAHSFGLPQHSPPWKTAFLDLPAELGERIYQDFIQFHRDGVFRSLPYQQCMFTHTTATAIPPPIVSTLRLVAGFVLSCG